MNGGSISYEKVFIAGCYYWSCARVLIGAVALGAEFVGHTAGLECNNDIWPIIGHMKAIYMVTQNCQELKQLVILFLLICRLISQFLELC